jgi:hypothetical protein
MSDLFPPLHAYLTPSICCLPLIFLVLPTIASWMEAARDYRLLDERKQFLCVHDVERGMRYVQ